MMRLAAGMSPSGMGRVLLTPQGGLEVPCGCVLQAGLSP